MNEIRMSLITQEGEKADELYKWKMQGGFALAASTRCN